MANKSRIKQPQARRKSGRVTNRHEPQAKATNHLKPVFCFSNSVPDFTIDDCDKDKKAGLIDRLWRLSQQTWGDIQRQAHTKGGHEEIALSSFIVSVPPLAETHGPDMLVFRFCGTNCRIIGFRENEVLRVVWVDHSLKCYKHS